MIKLSVLDQSPLRTGGSYSDALDESIRLAQHCDSLGYHRYWLAEHHGSEGFAGSSPEIMVTRIASATQHIRVGSGGVMLMHYSPYKVAENFKVLETLFPNRIDLGVGRAPGGDGLAMSALAYGSKIGIEYFPAKLFDLRAFLHQTKGATEAFFDIAVAPLVSRAPQLWLLGSSEQSARFAAQYGLPYSFANFIAPDDSQRLLQLYQAKFISQDPLVTSAQANISVFVLCADTETQARQLAKSRDLWRVMFEKGQLGPCPSISEAENYAYSQLDKNVIARNQKHIIAGTPEQVKEKLDALAISHGVDEIMVISISHDFSARLRSYELLAQVYDLTPPSQFA